MRMTSTGAFRRALAAARPPKPPPTITTRGVFDVCSSAPSTELRLESFIHLFLKLVALEISLNFASTNDSQTGLPSLSLSADHYLFPNASFIICRARADNGPIPLPDRNHRPLFTSRQ